MKFRTSYTPEPSLPRLSPAKPIVMLGSCFADNLSARMRQCLWRAENPLGVLYNPMSIAGTLQLVLSPIGLEERLEQTLFQSYGIWHSWMFDSSVSSPDKNICLREMVKTCRRCHALLEKAEALFVTFGTAKVWNLKVEPYGIAANCHKQPQSDFETSRVSPAEIESAWCKVLKMLKADYPDLKVVFTVSPVRYLQDGFVENSRSKATLLLAIESLCKNHSQCSYFPAFEIFCDDLRDYRFYASDLIHPSQEGVDYVWEIFRQTYLDEEGEAVLRAGADIVRRFNHRPNIPVRTAAQKESLRKWKEDTLEMFYQPFHEAYPDTLSIEEL